VTSTTETATSLPPGPRWPDAVQAYLLMQRRPTIMRRLQKQYGDVFTVRMPYGPSGTMVTVVALADPEHIRQVFAGKVLMPAFTGRAMRGYRGLVKTGPAARSSNGNPARKSSPSSGCRRSPSRSSSRWSSASPTRHASTSCGRWSPASRTCTCSPCWLWKVPVLKRAQPWRGYADAQRRLDELLYSEIANRRSDPRASERGDLLSRLLRPDDDGDTLTDAELRDQLVTFLLAGHETTATTLAWTLHELAHRPELQREAHLAADRSDTEGDAFLEAIVKEAMRLRPVIFQATRTLTEPVELAGYTLPAGVVVSPVLGLIGVHKAHHPATYDFDPGRFLGQTPAANTWIPFGGGPRRCIGAAFSLMEAVEILREILTRFDAAPVHNDRDRLQPRGIINAPHRGAVLRLNPR
jgi:cytochrome P450